MVTSMGSPFILFHYLTLYQSTKSWPCPNTKRLQMTIFFVAITMISVFDRVENIVGKGANAGYQNFLLSPQSFQKDSYRGLLKVMIVW